MKANTLIPQKQPTGLSMRLALRPTKKFKDVYYAIVDKADYDLVKKYDWIPKSSTSNHTIYAQATIKINGKWKALAMHRLILNAPKDKVVDHINHNGLDNRRSNLRLCTHDENMKNLRIYKNKAHPRYKGPYFTIQPSEANNA